MIKPDGLLFDSGLQEAIIAAPHVSVSFRKLKETLKVLPPRSWALCGGGAVACYVRRAISPDIDLLVDAVSLQEIRRRFSRYPSHPNLVGYSIDVDGLDLDLIAATEARDYAALNEAEPFEFERHFVRAVPVCWLLATKLRTGREKDLADVMRLWGLLSQEGGQVWEFVRYLRTFMPDELADRIDELELLGSFDEIREGFRL